MTMRTILFALTAVVAATLWPTATASVKTVADGRAQFSVKAPEARSVSVSGSFGRLTLRKDASGVWRGETGILEPDIYTYRVTVDGYTTTDTGNYHLIHSDGVNQNYFITGGAGTRAELLSTGDVSHGDVVTTWIDQKSAGRRCRTTIYLPPGYADEPDRRYPVLYLLHGMGGDETSWVSLGRAAQILDNMIARGQAEKMIVVMPNGNVSQEAAPGMGKEGLVEHRNKLPRTMNGEFERSFDDIVEWTDANLRTVADKNHRAIAGLSMGGLNSLFVSAERPDMFSAVGLFSPAVKPLYETTSDVYKNRRAKVAAQMSAGGGPRLYYIGMGRKDFLYKDCAEFRAMLDELGADYVYNETAGGHEWRNWRDYLVDFAGRVFRSL